MFRPLESQARNNNKNQNTKHPLPQHQTPNTKHQTPPHRSAIAEDGGIIRSSSPHTILRTRAQLRQDSKREREGPAPTPRELTSNRARAVGLIPARGPSRTGGYYLPWAPVLSPAGPRTHGVFKIPQMWFLVCGRVLLVITSVVLLTPVVRYG